MALGFVDPPHIRPTFVQLKISAPAVLQPLYSYFEQQWLASVDIRMWNVYDTPTRTNNDCEGWHNRFNRAINRHHPNLWLDVIKGEQASTDVTRNQIVAGQNVVREVRKYKMINRRIETIKDRFRNGAIDIMTYLDGISFNLSQ